MITTETQSIIVSLFMEIDPVVSSESWKTWEIPQQIELANFLASLTKVNTAIRSSFDSTVWKGHRDGTVDKTVKPVRAESSRVKDAGTKSTADKLKELLK